MSIESQFKMHDISINIQIALHLVTFQLFQRGTCLSYLFSERIFQSVSVSCGFPKGSPLKAKVDPM